MSEENPQGIATDGEKASAYKAGLEGELVNAKASLKDRKSTRLNSSHSS